MRNSLITLSKMSNYLFLPGIRPFLLRIRKKTKETLFPGGMTDVYRPLKIEEPHGRFLRGDQMLRDQMESYTLKRTRNAKNSQEGKKRELASSLLEF